jgi:hypothetical protein
MAGCNTSIEMGADGSPGRCSARSDERHGIHGMPPDASWTMSGLGSAGYRWTATIDNPAVLEVVREPAPSAPANRPQSSSRDEQFAVIGLAPGETVVHFRQARSFEPGQPPISARDIAVQVKN